MPEATTSAAPTSVYDAAVQREGLSATHRYLLQQIPPHSTVLELGPASGYMTAVLAGKGCRVDAVELNARDAAKAAPFCRQIIVASLEDEGWSRSLSESYQFALMADVLEHLRNPEEVLRRVRRLLAADGVALVSLPNVVYWRTRLQFLLGRFEYTDTGTLDRTHLRFYTLASAQDMFRAAGFHIEKVMVLTPENVRCKRLKRWLRKIRPGLFGFNFIFHLRRDAA
ncbi:MAG: class I SAM-dependent methyltransferase [candidate division KSB1 bacterium]|nr:class I SAM-dependent methyltransferase [candidate division KSB1 bacterium]MDZ7273774.1 class I SAM-dependent methyltransferase [candidate division KSB1 bacterium]MDZ7285930.1 class I SAM-dependent methyltransferase [candidate division KSB1 bacterium]MDZ7298962.1 class I SAM-dependent methyltransferase [candidate division KSB1 bacterium]MDZ7308599.1 class I SAM-dependent methyltransferase [candidate division KSB1 bacterium]